MGRGEMTVLLEIIEISNISSKTVIFPLPISHFAPFTRKMYYVVLYVFYNAQIQGLFSAVASSLYASFWQD